MAIKGRAIYTHAPSRRVFSTFRARACILPASQSPSPKLETTRSLMMLFRSLGAFFTLPSRKLATVLVNWCLLLKSFYLICSRLIEQPKTVFCFVDHFYQAYEELAYVLGSFSSLSFFAFHGLSLIIFLPFYCCLHEGFALLL